MELKLVEDTGPDVIVAGQKCYTRKALAKALGKSEQTIAAWTSRAYGPPYFLIGRRVLYPEKELLNWLESKIVSPENHVEKTITEKARDR